MLLRVKKITFFNTFFVGLLLPFIVLAQNIESVVDAAQSVLNIVIPFLMTLAVAVFVWGVIMYISAGGDAEKEKTARGRIIYGLIGLFVLVAFWGLIAIVIETFVLKETTPGTLDIPGMPWLSPGPPV